MLLNISRGRPVSWRNSLPIFSEVCGKLNSGIKFPLSISLQYFHGSQSMGSWFLLLMKGPPPGLIAQVVELQTAVRLCAPAIFQ